MGNPAIRSVAVIDNDPAVLIFMRKLLEHHGYDVLTAEDGLSALALLEEHDPELMFIDLIMPNIGGDKLGRILRSQERFQRTYLIMISAISPEEEIDYLANGFDACIAKGPFQTMGTIVVELIDQLGTTITRERPGGIYGRELLFKREITRELLSTKRHGELILDNMAESIIETNPRGSIVFANPAASRVFGIPEERLLSSNFIDLFDGADRHAVAALIDAVEPNRPPVPVTVDRLGRILKLQILAVADEGGVSPVIIAQDQTELQRSRASLQEKEAMLDEIHHRVKNNLQIVSSLLQLSAKRMPDPILREIIQDTRRRVHSLALVHDKLYGAGDRGAIDAQRYLSALTAGIVQSIAADPNPMAVHVDARHVTLPMDLAVPCALITNELVTNALKHAFPGRTGNIWVTLTTADSGSFRLEVRDDGVGLNRSVDLENSTTLGFRIVGVLARQIGAVVRFASKQGLSVTMEFQPQGEKQ